MNCVCYDTAYGFLNVPSQVVKGKSFTAKLQVQCNSCVGVVMFTLTHSDEIKYKSCKVNDNSCGYIEELYTDNTLSVVYINTQGITATDVTNLIDVTFQADDNIAGADIKIYTSYGASGDEVALLGDSGKEYSIDIVEKVTDNQSANGTDISDNTVASSNDKSSSSAINKEILNNATESTEISPTDQATTNHTISASNSSNSRLFVAGATFAIAVLGVIAASYKAGKGNKIKNDSKN